jgi:hypothetical protein
MTDYNLLRPKEEKWGKDKQWCTKHYKDKWGKDKQWSTKHYKDKWGKDKQWSTKHCTVN